MTESVQSDVESAILWCAGYEGAFHLAMLHPQFLRHGVGSEVFVWCAANDSRVPPVVEGHPDFWPIVNAVAEGAEACLATLRADAARLA